MEHPEGDNLTGDSLKDDDLLPSAEGPSVHQRRAAFILEGWCLLFVGVVGIVGNFSAIVVFGRQRVQRNFHALMVTLAAFDLCYICVSAFIFSLPQFAPGFNTTFAYTHTLPFVLPLAQIGLTGSIYLTCAVTLERYFTVCHPFYRFNHAWSSWVYIVPIVVFAFAYNAPKFFELSVVVDDAETYRQAFLLLHGDNEFSSSLPSSPSSSSPPTGLDSAESYRMAMDFVKKASLETSSMNVSDTAALYRAAVEGLLRRRVEPEQVPEALQGKVSGGGSTRVVYMNIPTTLRLNQVYVEVFCGWANFVVHTLLPYLALIVLNLLILRRLNSFAHQASSPTQVSSGAGSGAGAGANGGPGDGTKKKDVLLAKISLVIVFVFIVCHSVRWVPNIYELYLLHTASGMQILKWPDWVEIMSNLSHVLTVVNSSVNFYIYLVKHPNILVCYRRWKSRGGAGSTETWLTFSSTAPHATHHTQILALENNGDVAADGGRGGDDREMRAMCKKDQKEEEEEEEALLKKENTRAVSVRFQSEQK